MRYPKGLIAAMSTPFFEDETLNEEELRHQVDRLIAAGVHGIFVLGTNGENYTMEFAEKVKIMEIVINQAKHRIPVFVGTGCVTTKETLALSKKAQELGADYLSIISPWFAQNTQEGLYEHFATVAKEVNLPIVIYNMPARTGINIDYKTMEKLAKLKNIVGIKDSSCNFDNMQRYLEIPGRTFSVLSGNDSLILPCLLAGGQGGISGLSNVIPERMVSIVNEYEKGNIEEAWRLQRSVRPLRDCMQMANPNSVVKCAAAMLGQKLGPCRAPFNINDESLKQAIKKSLELVQD
ncbi:MAG: 4-hydroxy-tetrahydrodipicolinate synthase [Erysipelotrichia bacterium]|jgi:4-hydroxy-tetrahydrodipicolinate synthase|nr:4-hydroxy-tetrahydrodipicolinate synthase [Erysipelotrichia bacterium]